MAVRNSNKINDYRDSEQRHPFKSAVNTCSFKKRNWVTNSAQHELTKTVTTVYGACVYTTRLLARTTQYFFFFPTWPLSAVSWRTRQWRLYSVNGVLPPRKWSPRRNGCRVFSCFDIETNIGQRGNRLMCLHEGFAGGAKSRRQKCSHQTTQCEQQENEG